MTVVDTANDIDDAVSDDGFVYAEVEVVSVEGTDSEDDDEGRKDALWLSEEDRGGRVEVASPSRESLTAEEKNEVGNVNDDRKKNRKQKSRKSNHETEYAESLRESEDVPREVQVDDASSSSAVQLGIRREEENDQKIQRQTQFTALANATKTNQDAVLLCERLKREIQTHKTHRLRLEQEKREQMKTIKRLKKEAEEVFAPAIEDLNAKYGVAMKDRTMLTIERDKLMKKVKGLEKELGELKEAQKKKMKTTSILDEEKEKAKAKPTTSKIATRMKATEHKVAKEEEREETSSSTPSPSVLLKKFKKRQKKSRAVSQEFKEHARQEAFDQTELSEKAAISEAKKDESEEDEKKEVNQEHMCLSQPQSEQHRRKPTSVNVTHARLFHLAKSEDNKHRFASALHPSKKCIAYGDENGGWRMLDTNTGELIASFENFATSSTNGTSTNRVTFLSFSSTGKILLCGDARGCVSLFDMKLAKRVLFFPHFTTETSAPPILDAESAYCVFINDTDKQEKDDSATPRSYETAITPAVTGISLSPNETFVAVTYKHSNIFKIFDCCYSVPKESLELSSLLVCEIKTECSPDISSVDFINDSTVIVRDDDNAAYRVSF